MYHMVGTRNDCVSIYLLIEHHKKAATVFPAAATVTPTTTIFSDPAYLYHYHHM